jgi:hypothetical protein
MAMEDEEIVAEFEELAAEHGDQPVTAEDDAEVEDEFDDEEDDEEEV